MPRAPRLDAPITDGRRLRAVRTRAAIVAAVYDLVRAGDPSPTSARIAERAGVALRSIGQHFPSREGLLTAVAEHHTSQTPRVPPGVTAAGDLPSRIAAFARARAAELEFTAGLRRAVAVMPSPSTAIVSQMRRELDRRRDELSRVFAPELGARAPDVRRRLLDRLDVVSSGPAWDVLRRLQRHPAKAATAELEALLLAVLGG